MPRKTERYRAGDGWRDEVKAAGGLVALVLALPDREAVAGPTVPIAEAVDPRLLFQLVTLHDEAVMAVRQHKVDRRRGKVPADAVRALAEDLGRRLLDLAGGVPAGRPRRVDHGARRAAVYAEANVVARRTREKRGAFGAGVAAVAAREGVRPSTVKKSLRRATKPRK